MSNLLTYAMYMYMYAKSSLAKLTRYTMYNVYTCTLCMLVIQSGTMGWNWKVGGDKPTHRSNISPELLNQLSIFFYVTFPVEKVVLNNS